MAKANIGGLIIVGGIIIVLLLFSGLIISSVSTGLSGLIDFINNLLSGGNPFGGGGSSGGNVTGNAWFAFTVHFRDGTTSDINMNPTFSIFPMSVSFTGKTITQLDVLIRVQLSGTNLGAWNTQASQHIEIYLKPNTTPATSSTGSFSDSGNSWTSGDTQTVLTTSIMSATLDSIFRQSSGFSDWLFQTTGTINMTISDNGTPQTLSATLTAGGVDLSFNPSQPSYSIATITGTNFVKYPLHK